MSEPLVSVVLSVFNGQAYLERAVSSILEQTHRNLDVIVIDDGSTDDSSAILKRLGRQDSRLRVHARENRGLVASLNEGLTMARGDLIARMDADDIAYPDRLRRQVQVFEERPDLAMCGAEFDILFSNGRLERRQRSESLQESNLVVLSIFHTMFRHPTVMFNRKVAGDELYYDAAYPDAEDMDLFSRLTARHPTCIIDEPLLAYRVHSQSVTATSGARMRRSHLRILRRNLAERGQSIDIDLLLEPPHPRPAGLLDAFCRLNEQIERFAAAQPRQQQPAFVAGASSFYFFLLRMAEGEQGNAFAIQFLDRTNGWGRLRRRERLPVRAFKWAPPLAAAAWAMQRRLDEFERLAHTQPPERLHLDVALVR